VVTKVIPPPPVNNVFIPAKKKGTANTVTYQSIALLLSVSNYLKKKCRRGSANDSFNFFSVLG